MNAKGPVVRCFIICVHSLCCFYRFTVYAHHEQLGIPCDVLRPGYRREDADKETVKTDHGRWAPQFREETKELIVAWCFGVEGILTERVAPKCYGNKRHRHKDTRYGKIE
jgi:hypothetical protein